MSTQTIHHLHPVTPGQRFTRLVARSFLLKLKRLKKDSYRIQKQCGRNHSGQITLRHRGGGHPHHYRNLDFSREKAYGIVQGLEYDPNRNAWIQRLFHPDEQNHHYILGVQNLERGKIVRNYGKAKLKKGHHHPLGKIPIGYVIHNLSATKNKGGQYLKAAGTYGQILQKTKTHARLKIRSGEHRLFPLNASASLGAVANENDRLTKLGKAGRRRWIGSRPYVRGVAINPVDHPHGGGEGKTSGGRPSVTPWGKPTKGQPTVRNLSKFCLLSRKQKN